jgi:hypothetical protein
LLSGPPPPDGIEFRRNRLPQWRLDGGVYFITWRLNDQHDQLSPAERWIVVEEICAGKISAADSASSW